MMKLLKLFIALSLMLFSTGLYAQREDGVRTAPPKMKTPDEIAKNQADMMKLEVGLTDKQYKKVYKLIKGDHQYRQNQAKKQFENGMPPQGGRPGGMGGPGGGMMGGAPGSGFGMGGPGGGMPQQGEMQRPEGKPGMIPGGDVVSDEYLEKQDNKLRKILTEEQYGKWRSKHPAEYLQMPPIEFDLKN